MLSVFDSVIKMVTIKVGLFFNTISHTQTNKKSAQGSYVGNRRDTTEALDFYARGLIKAPFKTVGLSQLNDVFDLMHKGQIAGRYVVDTSK